MQKFGLLIVSINMALVGCSSSSILIKSEDATFVRSQHRLEQTAVTVEASGATPRERTLFLQAEGFYRYRFEPPERSKLAYFAEAAASITDFPAFQSLAESLSLLDIRLRAQDSAVQLWETLLTQHPQTMLRPLTLYRLGWAYRNTAAEGLPRAEPNDAFDELIHESPRSDLAALAIEAKGVAWKSKSTAAARSIIPGLGQIYVGETRNGFVRLSVAFVSALAVAIPLYVAAHRNRDLKWDKDWPLLATGLGGLIVLSFDYTSSFEDSMRGVLIWNERAEDQFNASHPDAP